MKTIETTIEVDDQRKATIQLPADAKAGSYRAVILVFAEPETGHPTMADFPQHAIPWPFPEGYMFRREDMYDDSGRGDLFIAANLLAQFGDPQRHIPAWVRRWAPWLTDLE